MELLIPLLVAVIFYAPLLVLSTRGLSKSRRHAIVPIVLGAFAVRVAVATIFATIPATRVFHEDAAGAEFLSEIIAKHWHGSGPGLPDWTSSERNFGLVYLFASVEYLFGSFPLNITVFNSFIGAMTVVLVYRISLQLLEDRIAKRAALFMSFFPSMIIWSSIAIKDPVTSFLICIVAFSVISLRERFSLLAVIGTLAPIVAVYLIRFYLVYFMSFSLVGTMVLGRRGDLIAGASKQLLLFGGLFVIVVFFGFTNYATSDLNFFSLERVSSYRHGMAVTANSAFATDADVSTPGRALLFLPLGMTTLIWGPFPWQMKSLRPLLSLPEMLAWWWLAPSLLRGFWYVLRKDFRRFAPLIVFSLTLLVAYSLTMGNLGAAYRMRAQIFVFMFIFAAFGIYLKKARTAGVDVRFLVSDEAALAQFRRTLDSESVGS